MNQEIHLRPENHVATRLSTDRTARAELRCRLIGGQRIALCIHVTAHNGRLDRRIDNVGSMLTLEGYQSLGCLLETRGASEHEAALKTCRRHRDSPTFAFSTQQIEGWYANIVKENLGKPGQAV